MAEPRTMKTFVMLATCALWLGTVVGCADDAGGSAATDVPTTSDGATDAEDAASGTDAATTSAPDTADATDAASTSDGGDATGADGETTEGPPNIAVALDCGAGPPGGLGNAGDLQRLELDVDRFPDALCNDGTVGALYFRPYEGEENRDKWLINLNGGGGCGTAANCAARWCWCRRTDGPNGCPFATSTTNFSMANMTTDERASIGDGGINLRGDAQRDNPLGGYNHVRLVYCSSDGWTGTRRAVPLEAPHPKTGVPVAYSIHFLGARVLDAAFATLRRDGVDAPRYTADGAPRDLPDLDDASEVVISGDSAGGAGVISNLDHLAELLRTNNTSCQGAACPLIVRGLIDAVVGPDMSRLGFEQSFLAASGGDSYEDYVTYLEDVPEANHGGRQDASCQAWHAAQEAASTGVCGDISHVIRHHVTTPFFVRMALLDGLISANYIEAGVTDPDLGELTVQKFALILRRELATFPELVTSAEEADALRVAPGVFAPACEKHDTIHDDGEVYETSITPEGGSALTLFDVFEAWRAGTTPSALLTSKVTREDTFCAP